MTSSSTLCLGWLLYQRICNTFSSLPYPCSELSYTLYYFHIFIYTISIIILNCMVIFFFVLPLYMIMGRIKIILILIQMAIFLNLVHFFIFFFFHFITAQHQQADDFGRWERMLRVLFVVKSV